MKYLYANKINSIISNINNSDAIVENLVDCFYAELVIPDDQKLLDLAFSEKISQSELDNFLKNWDIEEFGGARALLLSYVMKNHPYLKFSAYEAPRLAGLMNFYRFHNLQIIAHYTKVGKALNKAGIVPMILKGGAMKYLRPELSRVMGDIDILVPDDAFAKSCEISKSLGYVLDEGATEHSVDLHLPGSMDGTVDIHRYIDLENDYDKSFMKTLFSRASKHKVFGTEAFVPCPEDMVFIGLINLARNLHRNSSVKGILYTPFDFKFLKECKPDFNWDMIIENANRTNTLVQLFLVMKFVNKIVPGLLPEALLQNKFLHNEATKYCNRVMFYHFYVHDVKMRCKKLKIKNALRSFAVLKDYLDAKPKHFVLKRIDKNYTMIKIFLKIAQKIQRKKQKCA